MSSNMQSTNKTGPTGNDTERPQANPDPKGKGKEKERPQANPDPKGKGKQRMAIDWAEEAGESSRSNAAATTRPEGPGLEESSWNPFNSKGFKNPASGQNDRQAVAKKRGAPEMDPNDQRLAKAMKYQDPTTTDVVHDEHKMPTFLRPTKKSIWDGTNVATPYGGGLLARLDPATSEGQNLQKIIMKQMARESPSGEVVSYTAPAIEQSRGSMLKESIEGIKYDESQVRRASIPRLSDKQKQKPAQTQPAPQPRQPATTPRTEWQVRFEQRSSWCAVCGSNDHGTGDCPGGYEMRHGDVPICPDCHTTSANDMKGHTFDAPGPAPPSGQKDWGCRRVREADRYYLGDARARDYLIQHLLVGRKGKAPVRVFREEHCFLELALDVSRRWCNGQMPEEIGSVWPLTKEDAVRHAGALKIWDSLAPEDRPRSSLDGLDIREIRRRYVAGDIPAQVYNPQENIEGQLRPHGPYDFRTTTPADKGTPKETGDPSAAGPDPPAPQAAEEEEAGPSTGPATAEEEEAGPRTEPATVDDSLTEILKNRRRRRRDSGSESSLDVYGDKNASDAEGTQGADEGHEDLIDYSDDEQLAVKPAIDNAPGDVDGDDDTFMQANQAAQLEEAGETNGDTAMTDG